MMKRHGQAPRTVCEVGCGAGQILVELWKALPPDTRFYGYEISPQAFEMCQTRETDRLEFHLDDLTTRADVYYDLLLAIDVLEHVPDYMGFLERLREKGEYKMFHIPLDLSVSSLLRMTPLVEIRQIAGHLHYFTQETAVAVLEDAGYQVLDSVLTAGALEQPKNRRRLQSQIAMLPRRIVGSVSKRWSARLFGGYSLLVLAR